MTEPDSPIFLGVFVHAVCAGHSTDCGDTAACRASPRRRSTLPERAAGYEPVSDLVSWAGYRGLLVPVV